MNDQETEKIHNWNKLQLEHYGLSEFEADLWADVVDVEDFRNLVIKGCPAPLAVEILR